MGILWLIACLLFWLAAGFRIARHESWWIAGAAGVLLSQGLVVFQWADAKAGTVPNLLIWVAVVIAAATARFELRVDDEIGALVARAAQSTNAWVARPENLERTPAPVQRWLKRSGALDKERPNTVRLLQRGAIRTSPDGAWMPAEAEQYFSVNPPGFVWRVKTTMGKVLPIVGRDKYADGKGHMLIEAASLAKVVDATGDKIDQGTMLRFLGEIVWFPGAALAPYIEWKAIDEESAEATMRHAGVTASAVFTFDEAGRFSSMTAQRYMGSGSSAKLERWVVRAHEWRVIRGVEVPVAGNVTWKLPAGDFDYYRWEILDIEYDPEPAQPEAAEVGPTDSEESRCA